jgi:hypothetical protein
LWREQVEWFHLSSKPSQFREALPFEFSNAFNRIISHIRPENMALKFRPIRAPKSKAFGSEIM